MKHNITQCVDFNKLTITEYCKSRGYTTEQINIKFNSLFKSNNIDSNISYKLNKQKLDSILKTFNIPKEDFNKLIISDILRRIK